MLIWLRSDCELSSCVACKTKKMLCWFEWIVTQQSQLDTQLAPYDDDDVDDDDNLEMRHEAPRHLWFIVFKLLPIFIYDLFSSLIRKQKETEANHLTSPKWKWNYFIIIKSTARCIVQHILISVWSRFF